MPLYEVPLNRVATKHNLNKSPVMRDCGVLWYSSYNPFCRSNAPLSSYFRLSGSSWATKGKGDRQPNSVTKISTPFATTLTDSDTSQDTVV